MDTAPNTNTISGYFERMLNGHSRSGLRLWERISLFLTGWSDGMHELPCADAYGHWGSATISKELCSCTEAHNKVYGTLRIEVEDTFKAAASLASALEHGKKRLAELKRSVPSMPDEDSLHVRKLGEEALDEGLIFNRRRREHERRINSVLAKIDQLDRELEAKLAELIDLRESIAQKNYEAELVCEKIRAHTKQRIDYYWDIAYRCSYRHKRVIPPAYSGFVMPDVVDSYKLTYQVQDNRIDNVIGLFNSIREVA